MRLARGAFRWTSTSSLPASGITVLFGPSGSGKTTVLRCVAGLERAAGHVRIAGRTGRTTPSGLFLPAWRRPVGYVFQEASLFPHLDVAATCTTPRSAPRRREQPVALDTVVGLLGIGHLLDRGRRRCPAASASAWPSPAPWPRSPRCCCSTSRWPPSTPPPAARCCPGWNACATNCASPCCTSPTRPTRWRGWPTRWCCWTRAAWSPAVRWRRRWRASTCRSRGTRTPARCVQGRVAERDARWHLARMDIAGGALWLRDDGLAIGDVVRVRVLARDVSLLAEAPVPGASSIQNVLACTVSAVAPAAHPSQVLVQLDCAGDTLLARITARAADAWRWRRASRCGRS
jgi:molybdate transport system ATP-binding protein